MAREGLEFGVLERKIAVGGQQLALRGLDGTTATCSCRCSASTRSNAVRALAAVEGFAGTAEDGRTAHLRAVDVNLGRQAFAGLRSPGPGGPAAPPHGDRDAAHNPAGMAASRPR